MIYGLHPKAESELTSATLYYYKEANRSIALAFLAEFERVAALIEANQQLGTKAKGGLRVYPLRRFPYSIVYRESTGGPYLYAVAHQRQAPAIGWAVSRPSSRIAGLSTGLAPTSVEPTFGHDANQPSTNAASHACTVCRCSPSPSMPSRIVSPALR